MCIRDRNKALSVFKARRVSGDQLAPPVKRVKKATKGTLANKARRACRDRKGKRERLELPPRLL